MLVRIQLVGMLGITTLENNLTFHKAEDTYSPLPSIFSWRNLP